MVDVDLARGSFRCLCGSVTVHEIWRGNFLVVEVFGELTNRVARIMLSDRPVEAAFQNAKDVMLER